MLHLYLIQTFFSLNIFFPNKLELQIFAFQKLHKFKKAHTLLRNNFVYQILYLKEQKIYIQMRRKKNETIESLGNGEIIYYLQYF